MNLKCLQCGEAFDSSFSPNDPGATPSEGDLSICMYCGALAMHTWIGDEYGFRPLTTEEFKTVMADEYVIEVLAKRVRVMGGW